MQLRHLLPPWRRIWHSRLMAMLWLSALCRVRQCPPRRPGRLGTAAVQPQRIRAQYHPAAHVHVGLSHHPANFRPFAVPAALLGLSSPPPHSAPRHTLPMSGCERMQTSCLRPKSLVASTTQPVRPSGLVGACTPPSHRAVFANLRGSSNKSNHV